MSGPNADLAYAVLDQIDAHPDSWEQDWWWSDGVPNSCGTAGCFAGWAVALSGEKPYLGPSVGGVFVADRAAQLLGFESRPDMHWAMEAVGLVDEAGFGEDLFHSGNTREDLGRMVEGMFGPRPGGPS